MKLIHAFTVPRDGIEPNCIFLTTRARDLNHQGTLLIRAIVVYKKPLNQASLPSKCAVPFVVKCFPRVLLLWGKTLKAILSEVNIGNFCFHLGKISFFENLLEK